MKLHRVYRQLFVAAFMTFLAQIASAHPLLTYTSDNLFFKEGYLNGYPDDSVGSADAPPAVFSISFFGNTLSEGADIAINDAGVLSNFHLTPINNVIDWDLAGNIVGWDLSFFVEEKSFSESDGPQRITTSIQSSYGENRCNCDKYFWGYDLVIPRAYEQWQVIGELGFLYQADSNPDNWIIKSAPVPETSSYLLLLTGLVMLGVVGMRKKIRHQ
ncbi:PEP-CTERM sorting domain-containing protein [Cellvibrio mixtus]|uniref:PEP-CTERM sorting domain-containing protein n=1 Tax=Cellvibrio mixtus TaxID=39650 RepID=UPI000587892B|nr:PEP-CTERM sorting domain-containing protein [Cellvibrio mixtus]